MLGGKNYRGTKYSVYTVGGQDNPLCKGPRASINSLTEFLTDSTIGSQEDKKLAAQILQWVSDREQLGEDFWIDLHVRSLWESPEYFGIRDVVGKEGSTRECVSIKELPSNLPKPKQVTAA
jgi:hypothetical protein